MARKKIVFVIVEGPSDDEALELLLDGIYDSNTVYVHIVHGDVTTERDSSGNYVRGFSIMNKIGKIVKEYMDANHFKKEHFREIVHLIDMDGAYVSNGAIVYDEKAKDPLYLISEIRTNTVEAVIKRNEQKRGCINRLSATPTLCGIRYQAYYMSCNLDHVLYDKLNLTDEEKESNAISFSRKYKDNISAFIDFISNSSFSVKMDYLDSWQFIKSNNNSLKRFTNFGICIERALDPN